MAAKLTRLTHRITIQLQLVAETCIICSSRHQAARAKTSGYTLVLEYNVFHIHKANLRCCAWDDIENCCASRCTG